MKLIRWIKRLFRKELTLHVGIDFGYDGRASYIIAKYRKDGAIEILDSGELTKSKAERIKQLGKLFDTGKIHIETTDLQKLFNSIHNYEN